jgi:[acyl-carrier-protein] S-malonyltransferase
VAAGHSLGEYAACVAAGALDFMDAVRLVHARGKFMQNAVPEGEGAMAAVLGLTYEKVLEITACATAGLVAAANINSPGQVVISGEKAAVAEVAEEAQKEGARKVIPLAVSAPFHCSLMQPAADKLQAEFSKVKFQNASFPVVANVTGEYITAAEEIRTKLIEQVTGAVLWQQSVENMITQGIKVFVEMGPKRVLSGLIKKINAGVKLLNVEDQKSLDATLEELSKN